MKYQNPIYTEKTECQDCYKCIRECPVKAIRVENGHAIVVSEQCILCGHCVMICPTGAKHIRNDLSRARQQLTLKERVIVSLAPSFIAEFSGVDPRVLIAAIKKLGFYGVSETALGADLVSAQIADDFKAADRESVATGAPVQKLYLSSACPVTVEYIKLYMSEFTPYITDRASPLLAHARFLKRFYGEETGIVFVGPCIAKKREADIWQMVDCAITFQDLRQWLHAAAITLTGSDTDTASDSSFIPYQAAKGALYPVDGGMIAAIEKYQGTNGIHMMAITGIEEIEKALKGLEPQKLAAPLFMELLACAGGCINGPGASTDEPTALRRINLLEYAHKRADILNETRPDMAGTLPGTKTETIVHSDAEMRGALRQVGKLELADELNCGSCGYDTCRSFAAAMLEHRAEKTMCVSYMRKLAQKKANGIIGAIPSGVVICDAACKIIECNENFARLLDPYVLSMYEAEPGLEGIELEKITGGMSRFFYDVMTSGGPDVVEHEYREGKKIFYLKVFSIEKGESACGVVQDVTVPQIQKSRVIKQTRKVINKNLAVVQKIAYLLGENAAETEATLNSIIESFSGGEEDAP